jgi:hypothetical protein
MAWLAVAVCLCLLNLHILVSYSIMTSYVYVNETSLEPVRECVYSTNAQFFYASVWPWIDSVALSFLPTLILIPSNLLIVSRVWVSRRMRSSCLGAGASSSAASVTAMLVVISTVFVVTTTPLVLFYAIHERLLSHTLESLVKTHFARCVCNILFYTNSAVNFFLYCLSGSQFRVALGVTIGCSSTVRRRVSSPSNTLILSIKQQEPGRRRCSQHSLNDKLILDTLLVPGVARRATSDSCLSPV